MADLLQNPVVLTSIITAIVAMASVIISTVNAHKIAKINSKKEKELVLLEAENERLNNFLSIESNKLISKEKNNTDIIIAKVQTKEKMELLNRAREETLPVILSIDHIWEQLQAAKELLRKFTGTQSFNIDESLKELFRISEELKDNYGKSGIKVESFSEKAKKSLHTLKGQFATKLDYFRRNESFEKYIYKNKDCKVYVNEFCQWITEHQELLSHERRKIETERFNDLMKLLEKH